MGDASKEAQENPPIIYVTGFGPFQSHPVNASQVAVENLKNQNLESDLGVKLVTETVKVEYDYVKKTIPQRWKELNPKVSSKIKNAVSYGLEEILKLCIVYFLWFLTLLVCHQTSIILPSGNESCSNKLYSSCAVACI